MVQPIHYPPLSLQSSVVRQAPTISTPAHPLPVQGLAQDSLDFKSVGVGALAGALVAGNYSLKPAWTDSLKTALVEKSTLVTVGGAALAGGIAGSVAGRNTHNTTEALTTGAIVGMTIGALSGAALAVTTQTMSPTQGALRGAMIGGFSGGAGGAGAYLLRTGE